MQYLMPPNTNEKEKIAFGLFDISQILQFAVFTIIGVVLALIVYGITGSLIAGILLMLPFIGLGILFAVKKVNGLMLSTYIKLKIKHKRKIKYYINGGFHKEMTFTADIQNENK